MTFNFVVNVIREISDLFCICILYPANVSLALVIILILFTYTFNITEFILCEKEESFNKQLEGENRFLDDADKKLSCRISCANYDRHSTQ